MQTLEKEINRIKKELADIGFKFMFGKTCEELVEEIFSRYTESTRTVRNKS